MVLTWKRVHLVAGFQKIRVKYLGQMKSMLDPVGT